MDHIEENNNVYRSRKNKNPCLLQAGMILYFFEDPRFSKEA